MSKPTKRQREILDFLRENPAGATVDIILSRFRNPHAFSPGALLLERSALKRQIDMLMRRGLVERKFSLKLGSLFVLKAKQ